jgi:hypothetical protein
MSFDDDQFGFFEPNRTKCGLLGSIAFVQTLQRSAWSKSIQLAARTRNRWRPLGGAMMKPLCIIAAAMSLVVASSTAMAEPKKRSVSDKATHRMKSVSAPLRQWPPNNPTFREYEELKRQGWYKADKA